MMFRYNNTKPRIFVRFPSCPNALGLRPERNENFLGGGAGVSGNNGGHAGGNTLSVSSSSRRHNVILNCTEENCNKESEWHELEIIGK